MTDFEKVTGGAEAARKRKAAIYRNPAGVEHIIDIIDNTSNDPAGIRVRDIEDCLSKVGVVTAMKEAPLEDVVGGSTALEIDDRRFDSIWKKKDPRKILRIFKNADGSIRRDAAVPVSSIARAEVVREILNEMSMPGKERLLLAGILLSDDDFDIESIDILK